MKGSLNLDHFQQLMDHWDKESIKYSTFLMPGITEDPAPHTTLFVGLNPSFSAKSAVNLRKKAKGMGVTLLDNWDPPVYYDFQYHASFNVQKAYEIDEFIRTHDHYHIHFKNQAGSTEWSHIDLFACRKTQQESVVQMFFSDLKTKTLNSFGRVQFELALQRIESSQPHVIVVVNATARELIQKEWKERLYWNEEVGYDLVKIAGRDTPIFFSSMLTGIRPLDIGSRDRLAWHIRQAKTQYPI